MVMRILCLALVFLAAAHAAAQESVRGTVRSRESGSVPVIGANVYWIGSSVGTTTDTAGTFVLRRPADVHELVIRHAAYEPDTLDVHGAASLEILLTPSAHEIQEVQTTGDRASTTIDYMDPRSMQTMTQRELTKAACCNLSESFETNPSIDVSFTDAITGTRQIEMLGLSGIYTQTTMENVPYIRGLTSTVGLSFVPGPWVKAINVSKGVGSVANGYESITGQIDVDLRQPQEEEESRVLLNAYGNQDKRFEGNLHLRQPIGEHWSSMTQVHASSQREEVDGNSDGFLDMPLFTRVSLGQRFHYSGGNGWQGQLLAQYANDRKDGGTRTDVAGSAAFPYDTRAEFLRLGGKTGYVLPGSASTSVGLQWYLSSYRTASTFGMRSYDGVERTGYVNLLFQSEISSPVHKYRVGISALFDNFDEQFQSERFDRIERVPGVFLEYTYAPMDDLTVMAGLRADHHNAYGTMVTPRFHVRYALTEDWVARFVAGRGYRTANIFTENATVFASNREVVLVPSTEYGYGMDQEVAWNYGFNLTHYFLVDYREATVALDAYRTVFQRQVVADLDTDPQQVRFLSVADGSYANSIQLELNIKPLQQLETRVAYRFLDVRQRISGRWLQKPLSAKHRALVNMQYLTPVEQEGDPRTAVDLTVQWFGSKRIPSTAGNPEGHRARETSPEFATVNLQVSQTLAHGFELYLGAENLLGFRQNDPILDAHDPHSPYFDASLVWGPVSGRMVYAGLRYRL